MDDPNHAPDSGPASSKKRRRSPRRKAVSADRLIELIKAQVESVGLGDIPAPVPIPIIPRNGEANWKIDQVIGVPATAFADYMAVVQELMREYELK